MIDKDYLLQTIKHQFVLDYQGIHGLPHWERVAANGRTLSALTGANPKVVEYFAYLHDSKRQNDDHDPEHGLRASRYCRQLYSEGVIDLHRDELEQLCTAIRLHNMRYITGDITCLTCWDADRTDLIRVGITLNPDRLFTAAGKAMAMRFKEVQLALHD